MAIAGGQSIAAACGGSVSDSFYCIAHQWFGGARNITPELARECLAWGDARVGAGASAEIAPAATSAKRAPAAGAADDPFEFTRYAPLEPAHTPAANGANGEAKTAARATVRRTPELDTASVRTAEVAIGGELFRLELIVRLVPVEK